MNYSELTALLQDYLQNTETSFVANIPTFVRQAEERINRAVIIPDLRKTQTGTMTADNRYLEKPSDYLASFSLNYGTSTGANPDQAFLLPKSENFIREAYPNPVTDTGAPKYYGDFNASYWVLGPTPDEDYPVTIRYYYDPDSIVDSSTSWLGDNAETALLYGALVEAYTYLKGEPDLLELYNQRYETALEDLIRLGIVTKRDDYRDGEAIAG